MEEKPKKTIIFDSPRDLTKRRPSAKNSQGSFDLEMVEVDNYSVDSNALEEVDINNCLELKIDKITTELYHDTDNNKLLRNNSQKETKTIIVPSSDRN